MKDYLPALGVGLLGDAAGDHLASQVPNNLRGRPDENQPGIGAGLGEIGIFRQKSVTGVDGLGPGFPGGLNDLGNIEIVLARAGADTDGLSFGG